MQGSREPCISFLYYAASIGIETLCIGYLSLQKLFFYRVAGETYAELFENLLVYLA
jgi:hypothetical protein